MSRVVIIRCEDYERAQVGRRCHAIAQAFEALGGAERFASKGDDVLLKPNILKDTSPDRAVTAHPEILQAVGKQLENIAARHAGLREICDALGVRLLPFTKGARTPNPNLEGTVY